MKWESKRSLRRRINDLEEDVKSWKYEAKIANNKVDRKEGHIEMLEDDIRNLELFSEVAISKIPEWHERPVSEGALSSEDIDTSGLRGY